MAEAVRLVKVEQYSIASASLHLNDVKKNVVPRATIQDRLHCHNPAKPPKLGRPNELPEAVEKTLVKFLKRCGEFQYPMRKRELQDTVQAFCVQNSIPTRWTDDRPGREWVRKFLRRWSHEVKLRRPRNIKRCRSEVSPEIVTDFINRLQVNMENIPATHIINYDETCLQDDPGSELAFFSGGTKYCEEVRNFSKTSFSVMISCTAAGLMLPPMVVFRSANGVVYTSWCDGGPEGTVYAATTSGWFTMEMFNTCFDKVFLPYIKTLPREDKKVLIADNCASHMSPYVTEQCEKYNILFIFLPENSTNLLQPLDVAVFRPMKGKWRDELRLWKDEGAGKDYATLPKHEFPKVLKSVLAKDYSESIIKGNVGNIYCTALIMGLIFFNHSMAKKFKLKFVFGMTGLLYLLK